MSVSVSGYMITYCLHIYIYHFHSLYKYMYISCSVFLSFSLNGLVSSYIMTYCTYTCTSLDPCFSLSFWIWMSLPVSSHIFTHCICTSLDPCLSFSFHPILFPAFSLNVSISVWLHDHLLLAYIYISFSLWMSISMSSYSITNCVCVCVCLWVLLQCSSSVLVLIGSHSLCNSFVVNQFLFFTPNGENSLCYTPKKQWEQHGGKKNVLFIFY